MLSGKRRPSQPDLGRLKPDFIATKDSEPKSLDPVVAGIDQVNQSSSVNHQGVGIIEPARLAAWATPNPKRLPVASEPLNPTVPIFTNHQRPIWSHRKIIRERHLPSRRPSRSPVTHKFSLCIENLNPVVATIRHVKQFVGVHHQGPRAKERSRLIPVPTPLADKLTLRRKHLNAVELPVFTHIEIPHGIHHNIGRISKPPRGKTLHPIADLLEQITVLVINQNSIEMRIRYKQPTRIRSVRSAR